MNNTKLAIAIAGTLVIGIVAGIWWSHRTTAASPSTEHSTERKVLYWQDPMMPGQKFDKPGKSPFMDMQLVPVYADEAGDDSGVKINSSVTQSLGIRLGKAERTVVEQSLTAVGSVAFDEHRVQLVQARVGGYVTKLIVKAPLDPVRKGQALAEITSPEWQEAQREYVAMLNSTSTSAKEWLPAARDRLRVLDVPESVISDIERTRAAPNTTRIVAPLDGVISELGVREGAAFEAGALLFRITGLESVWVNAQVPEAQVHLVPMGATVVANATSWPGETFKGRVLALLPEVDATSRTFTVRAVLDNANRKLSPGMFVSLAISQPKGKAQLVVPNEAVIATGRRTVVIVAKDKGSFGIVDVVTGGAVGEKTIILKGLDEGQSIVLSGQFLIDSEASLTSTIDRLSSTVSDQASDATTERPLHLAEGMVTALTKDQITLSHGPVPSLKWNAMTMSFKSPAKGIPADLKPNDRVSFTFFENKEGMFEIDSITRVDENAPAHVEHAP